LESKALALAISKQIKFMQGPYPIFCRGHSGGRLVAEAFIRNGISLGQVAADRKDTESFRIANPLLHEIVMNAYHYLQANTSQRHDYQNLMKRCVTEYRNAEIPSSGPFGWKMGISLFTMLVVLDAFPTTKVIHLIRDGRDVMLSRLEARFAHLTDPINRLVVFGDANVDNFEGHPLTPETVATYRNELEMLHWVTAVSYGLQGRDYPARYLEVKYEAICQNPLAVFEKIFDFIEVPFLNSTKDWLTQTVYPTKIAKWKSLSAEQLNKPLEIGGDLLKKLDYL
jgi:hypothetical protein